MGFHLHFRANRYWPLCLEFLKKYYTAKLRAQGISLKIGLSGLIKAHGARDRAESTKFTALSRLRHMLFPLSQRYRITWRGHDAYVHELLARAWTVRPTSLTSANQARPFASTCSQLRAEQPAARGTASRARPQPRGCRRCSCARVFAAWTVTLAGSDRTAQRFSTSSNASWPEPRVLFVKATTSSN